jgi:hypothetical protein
MICCHPVFSQQIDCAVDTVGWFDSDNSHPLAHPYVLNGGLPLSHDVKEIEITNLSEKSISLNIAYTNEAGDYFGAGAHQRIISIATGAQQQRVRVDIPAGVYLAIASNNYHRSTFGKIFINAFR